MTTRRGGGGGGGGGATTLRLVQWHVSVVSSSHRAQGGVTPDAGWMMIAPQIKSKLMKGMHRGAL